MGNCLTPGFRLAARVVLLAPSGRILLLLHRGPKRPFWATPGGGLEPGESFEDAARRELREEVGVAVELGPWLWEDRWDFQGTARIQVERFYLARAPAEALPAGVEAFHRTEGILNARWWSVEAIAASGEAIYPERLAELLVKLRDEGPPPAPILLA